MSNDQLLNTLYRIASTKIELTMNYFLYYFPSFKQTKTCFCCKNKVLCIDPSAIGNFSLEKVTVQSHKAGSRKAPVAFVS